MSSLTDRIFFCLSCFSSYSLHGVFYLIVYVQRNSVTAEGKKSGFECWIPIQLSQSPSHCLIQISKFVKIALLTAESVWLPTSTVSLHMGMVWPPGNFESNVFSSHGYGNSHPHWGTPSFRGKKVPPLSAVFMARSVKTILLRQCFKGFREDVGIINMPF